MRLSFLDAFSKNKSTPTPGPSPRHTEPASGRDTTTNRSRRHGPGHSLQSPRIDVHQTSPTVEGASTGLPPMKPALDLWVTKSQRKLSDLAEMQAIHAIAQVSGADNPFWLRTVPAYIQTCIRETDPIRQPGQRTQLERQAAALNRVSNHIQLLTIVLSQDTEHGQAMAQRLLQWTLAELLDALGDPHMSADLMVLGLREGLSAAELIGMHRAGLTAQTVRQVRKAHELAGNPAPSLREMAIQAPPETVGTQALTWGLTHGFKPAEVPALLSAGWGSHTDAPPAPDEASRRLGALVPTQRSSRDGWTELTDPHVENPSAPYWFKPCTCSSQDEQRLRKGLFVQALAELLGLPQRTLPVRAHIRSHHGEPVYGVLIGPVPALRENARPPRSPDPDGLRQQEIEASWLAWLGDAEWRDQDRHWTNSRQDPQLCLGLPVATSDADTSDETPPRFLSMGHPKLIPVNLKQRMEALSVDALAPALAWLSPADRSAAETRWQQMDINRAIVLPPPQRDLTRARRITQLTTAQPALTPARSARLPRTWLQRLAPLQVAEDALLMAAASRLDTVEGFDADQAKTPPTPRVSRLITWGQLQRARAHLAQHLMAWDPTTVPPADRADAQRERQRLLDRLQGMPTSARHLSTRSVEKIRKAGADDDQLTALTSTLKTYAHLMHQPLPADDTALLQLQTLGEWARRLVSSVDKQVAALQQASDQPVPKELDQLRRALKTDLRLLSDAVVIAHELQAAPVDRPAMPVAPAELMALAGLTAITPAQRQAAWQAGATAADLIRVHSAEPPAGLPPAWALLADSLLQARAVQLAEEQNTLRPLDAQAVATMRRRLQTVYPLSEVAAMADLAMTTADARADAPYGLDTSDPSSAPKGRLPLAGSRVLRALGWGVELSDAEDSPEAQALDKAINAYDKAIRYLGSLPLDSPGLGTAAADAAQRLDDLHTALIATGSLNASSGLAGALMEEAAALKRLPTIAERLVTARPSSGSADALSPADTADRLLQLLSPSGPDERRLLHGRLAGWTLADIGLAHEEGLPAWVMDLDRSVSGAKVRFMNEALQRQMNHLSGQLALAPLG